MINVKELNKIVDKPYKYGKLDCLQLLRIAYGDKLPKSYKGVSLYNYTEKFDNPQEASKLLVEAIVDYCEQVKHPRFGDIIIVDKVDLIGLYAGNNHMLTAFIDKGIKVIPIIFPVTYWRLVYNG